MRRLCERPGCAAPAEVSYGIDNSSLTVWLDNSHVPEREHAGRLCRRHANALVVPRGWTVDDRRQPIPQLFRDLDRSGLETQRAARKPTTRSRKKNVGTQEIVDDSTLSDHADEPTLFETGSGTSVVEPDAVTVTEDAFVSEAKHIVVDPDETQAIAWSPASVRKDSGDTDVNEEDGPVFGRLMGRAFRQKGAQ